MPRDWEWQEAGISGGGTWYTSTRGAITLAVWADPLSKRWSFEAGIASPDEEEVDGVRICGDETYETKELAQLAAIDAMREFVETLHADFRGAA